MEAKLVRIISGTISDPGMQIFNHLNMMVRPILKESSDAPPGYAIHNFKVTLKELEIPISPDLIYYFEVLGDPKETRQYKYIVYLLIIDYLTETLPRLSRYIEKG